MRILTPDGSSVDVRQRAWPLAGLDFSTQHSARVFDVDLTGKLTYEQYSTLYKTNPWLNAGVRAITWGISRAPFNVYKELPDGQRERVRPGRRGPVGAAARLERSLRTAPGRMGPQRRMRLTMTDYLVHGNALWVPDEQGALWHVPWRRVTVHTGNNEPILMYEISGTRDRKYLAPEEVIHFCAGDDPDSPVGLSPLTSLRYTLALHEALQKHLVNFFENAARPSANLKLQPGANKETIERISAEIRSLYTSPDNAGKVVVTTGDFQPMTAAHDHSQIVELAKLSREEIAGVLRIPGPILGFLENAIKSNVKELREQYIRDVIGGWTPALEDDFMGQHVHPNPALEGFFTQFDLDEQLRPDIEGLAATFGELEHTATTNERRRMLRLPDLPYPEADTVSTNPGGTYLGIKPDEPDPTGADPGTNVDDPAKKPDPQAKPPKAIDRDLDGQVNEPK